MMQVMDEAGFTSVLGTNCDQTYERYLRVGEQVSITTRLESVVGPKRTGVGEGYYDQVLSESNVVFCFDSKPSLDDIALELDAYVDTWDMYPEAIVIDTLRNVDGNGEKQDDEWIIGELHSLARRTRACVFLLAHMSRANVRDSTKPPGIKELVNKLDSLPDLVLMVAYNAEQETLWVAVGKTREGRADPEAENPIPLRADFSRMTFGSYNAAPAWGSNEG